MSPSSAAPAPAFFATGDSVAAGLGEGRSEPMGAHARDGGVNFAVFTEHAEQVFVCLFETGRALETARFQLHGPHDGIFHGFLPGAGVGLVYGLRAHGPYLPEAGHLFNPHKLLLDPCAREIVGDFRWLPEHHGYRLGHADGIDGFDCRDNAGSALKARVAAPVTDSAAGRPKAPRHADADVVLYEVHVKGFSMDLPGLPPEQRGTYAGLAHPVSIAHFKALGVTTLSLLPVQYCVDEGTLAGRGMSNYWGYNTLGFFCPDPRLAQAKDPAEVAAEFRSMVDTFHRHDLEVVLDVVYNHTPEGNEHGPTLSFRGLDNASWYRLDASFRAENFTGCGNTVNIAHPQVTRFVLDSLRYWVQEMGVDGFRFDLAPVLGRTDHGFDAQAAFFIALRQDPLLAQVRLIAEPWDGGPDGYQVGRFPGRFQDWNDRFRDAMRGYWLGRAVDRGEFARRFTASNDLFHHHQRRPTASVNFIVAHDGFTLSDVVSYSRKRNLANGENNRDGRDDELSDNFGAEGATGDPTINLQRMRVRRAMMASLLLAQGTPMLCSGDEIGNSQHGNNNAYCQDNPTGWLDWGNADREFCAFVAELNVLRRGEPLLRHDSWFNEAGEHATGALLVWRLADGRLPAIADWHDPHFRALACVIGLADGSAASLLLVFNPGPAAMHFVLPTGNWSLLLDSGGELAGGPLEFSSSLDAPARCVVVLKQQPFPLDDP